MLLILGLWLNIADSASATTELDVDLHLRDLHHANAEVRVEAVRALLTSLDPRIPDEMLRLLNDEGNSIRRLAARAIGSRWWQIPRARVPEFVAALKRNATREFEDEQNMVARAIGLLTREYTGKAFARSTNRRWVIYERLGLPCLIDTQNGTEELLGWKADGRSGWILSALGNGQPEASALWQPGGEAVAFGILLSRRESGVWVWKHRSGLRQLEEEALRVLSVSEPQRPAGSGLSTDIKSWNGDDLFFEISFSISKGTSSQNQTATFGWNAATEKLRLISRVAR